VGQVHRVAPGLTGPKARRDARACVADRYQR
jgi:hypothetical protein